MAIRGVTGDPIHDGVLSTREQTNRNRRQAQSVNAVLDHWGTHDRSKRFPLLALPTGFGKGVIIQHLLKEVLHPKILLIVGAKNILLDQSRDVLEAFAAQESGFADYSIFPDTSGRVVLTTWQRLNSFHRRKRINENFGLIIVDEVHNIGTQIRMQLLRELMPDAVVGLTATALRSSGNYRWPEDYGFDVVDSMPLPNGIMERWLSPLAGIAIDTNVLLPEDVRYGQSLNLAKVNQVLRHHPQLFQEIGREVAERFLPSGMKTIVVVNRVHEEACVLARKIQSYGFKVGLAVNQSAASSLKGEFVTADAVCRYKLPHDDPDAIQVLISPYVIGEGFDAPATECVVWAAPTRSPTRYTQVVGRGARICPGKKFCLVVDFVYMIENYGYSYNFAQFMPKEWLQELADGVMYVGPEDVANEIELPSQFTRGGRLVKVVNLQLAAYPPAQDWLNITDLEGRLSKARSWIQPRLEDKGIKGEQRRDRKGRIYLFYPPSSVDILNADLASEAGDWVTASELVKKLNRGYTWVTAQLADLEIPSDDRENPLGQIRSHYPPHTIDLLMARIVPEAGDWLNANQIAKRIGRDPTLVRRRLRGAKGELREDSSKRAVMHYPPDILRVLNEDNAIPSAGDWLSENRIVRELRRNSKWIKSQAQKLGITQEDRKDPGGRVYRHYPPETLERLRNLL